MSSTNRSAASVVAPFLLLIIGALTVAALLAPWLFWWLELIHPFPFHRVFNRTATLIFIVGGVILSSGIGMNSREDLGYGIPRREFARQWVAGLALGVAMMSLIAAMFLMLGARVLRADVVVVTVASAIPKALLSGIAVGLLEETVFRGAMYSGMRRGSSVAVTTIATALLYASVHFLGERLRIAGAEVNVFSGLVFLTQFFGKLLRPLAIVDAFVALFLVGVLLAMVRERTGSIAAGMGLHAGFVATIVLIKKTSAPAFDTQFGFLINRIDGVVGWLVAGATLLAIAGIWRWPSSTQRPRRR